MNGTSFNLAPLLILLSLALLPGCAPVTPVNSDAPISLTDTAPVDSEISDTADSSCSYFYFLWATHAENNKHYLEAEEALEKALICDPGSRHILRRLPILLIKMGKPYGAAQWLRKAIELYPDDTQDRLLLARLDIRNNEIEEAIELYNELILLTPEDETILLRLGSLYAEQNQMVRAKETFKKALSLNPESLFTHLYLARLALKTGDNKGAEQWYTKALAINWSTELAYEVAAFYETQENYTKVAAQYLAILKKRPDETRAGLGLVHSLLLQDREQEALAMLQEIRLESEDPDQIDLITARLYLRSKKLDKAAVILKKILSQDNNPEAAYMLAAIYYQKKDRDQAMVLLRSIDPDANQFEDGVYLQIRIYIENKQDDKAMQYLQSIIEKEQLELPGFYSLLASLYLEQKQTQKAYDLLDIALIKFPDATQIYFEYGLLLEQDGHQEKAITLMKKVLEMDPGHAEALNYLAYTWADNNIHLDMALDYVLKSMQLKPDNGYIMDSLAWVYFRMGKLDKAASTIKRALDLEPDDPNIHEHQGDINLEQGKEKEALQAFQDAEKRFKKNSDKARLLKKIHALK
jgi:tetratricopeptide (TPR) repeat protein